MSIDPKADVEGETRCECGEPVVPECVSCGKRYAPAQAIPSREAHSSWRRAAENIVANTNTPVSPAKVWAERCIRLLDEVDEYRPSQAIPSREAIQLAADCVEEYSRGKPTEDEAAVMAWLRSLVDGGG